MMFVAFFSGFFRACLDSATDRAEMTGRLEKSGFDSGSFCRKAGLFSAGCVFLDDSSVFGFVGKLKQLFQALFNSLCLFVIHVFFKPFFTAF